MTARPDLATLELWLQNMAKEDPIYQRSCYELILYAVKERKRYVDKTKRRREALKQAKLAAVAANRPAPQSPGINPPN